jgi:hypothetical protein
MGELFLFNIKFILTMKKSFIIAAFAALTFTACNNSEKSSSDNSNSEQEQQLRQSIKTALTRLTVIPTTLGGNHTPADSTDKLLRSLLIRIVLTKLTDISINFLGITLNPCA